MTTLEVKTRPDDSAAVKASMFKAIESDLIDAGVNTESVKLLSIELSSTGRIKAVVQPR